MDHHDDVAAVPSWIRRALRVRRPSIGTPREFGVFCHFIFERWDSGHPTAVSQQGAWEEQQKLGCKVQKSLHIEVLREPIFDHRPLCRRVVIHAQEQIGRAGVSIWSAADVFNHSKTEIGESTGLHRTTVTRRLRGYRDAIMDALIAFDLT
jgi:hypothetical protein